MTRRAEFQVAMMMLTRLPMPYLKIAPSIGASVWAFPLVGGIVGTVAAAVMLCLLWLGVAGPMAAGLALGVLIILTGGLHEDGLADVADGFGGGGDAARKLEIMRDSQIGSYGGLALILSLGLRWQGLVVVLVLAGPWVAAAAMVAIAMASRAGIAAALCLMPNARADGMGKLASGTSPQRAWISALFGSIALVLVFGWAGVIIGLVMLAVQFGFAVLAKRQIGGQTGDVLGALQQISEIAAWVTLGALH